MRTTIDLDGTVLSQLRERQRREGKTLGQVASELLARALADTAQPSGSTPLTWNTRAMSAKVDLEDRDAVHRLLEAEP